MRAERAGRADAGRADAGRADAGRAEGKAARGPTADERAAIVAERDGRLVVNVRVVPRASREAIELGHGALRVRLTAPPVEGAANEALIALLTARLHLPKRAVTLVRGASARDKQLAIDSLSAADFWARLSL